MYLLCAPLYSIVAIFFRPLPPGFVMPRIHDGRADVRLDGKKAAPIDAWIPERTNDDDLWRMYDLKPGKHTLKIVTRDDADPRSKGKRVQLQGAIIYR